MTAILYLLVLAAFLALCWRLGSAEMDRQDVRVRYRTSHLGPHAHQCVDCRCGYSDQRALVWHRQAAHVETYERSES